MIKKTIKDVEVYGKKCLVRCDFNVPMKDGVITNDNRIVAALPTIEYLLKAGAKVILCSHLGRPKGEFNMKYSLRPVADRLNELLEYKVTFAQDVIGEDADNKVSELCNGEAVLLENLRFHAAEEKNDKTFCEKLAKYCDVYVNDAFGTAHRAHASTAGIVQYGFAKTAVSGFLIEKELNFMGKALENPERPFVAVLGGAKVSDKIGVINNLIEKVDALIIGGGMAYTFLRALGKETGKSLCEEDKIDLARQLIEKAKEKGVKFLLPVDVVGAKNFPDPIDEKIDFTIFDTDNFESEYMGLDIGPVTTAQFEKEIKTAGTVVWNGPMGVFENPVFAKGTFAIAKCLCDSNCISIVGGGDSAAAVQQMGFGDKISHISTGGGASLEFLEGKDLPGISCLNDK